jgi:hypothetical protein
VRGQLGVEGLGQLPGHALAQARLGRQRLGGEQLRDAELLELDRVAAQLRGAVHEGQTASQVALVVAAHLGDEARSGLHPTLLARTASRKS